MTFGVNMTTSELRIPLVNDDTPETFEYFTVNLGVITPNVVIATFTTSVTISDDERECTILHNVCMYTKGASSLYSVCTYLTTISGIFYTYYVHDTYIHERTYVGTYVHS